jgi:hypothetical protein
MANAARAGVLGKWRPPVVGGKPVLVFPELDAEDVDAFCRTMK